jgi:hypothetical protein
MPSISAATLFGFSFVNGAIHPVSRGAAWNVPNAE